MSRKIVSLILTLFAFSPLLNAKSESIKTFDSLNKQTDINQFAQTMAKKHGFDANKLNTLLSKARYRDDIIKAISRPAEGKSWYEYRPIFVTDARAKAGADFMNRYQAPLARAYRTYGVPPEIIVAILGVETRFGAITGRYRVLDSLTTLAFAYPRRAKFFKKELEAFLLLSREEQFDPTVMQGSYAGAMGHPQFISSSYRAYAVDFSGDGKRDIINNPVDAIGSIANYFKAHGWQRGEPIVSAASLSNKTTPSKSLKPSTSIAKWAKRGVTPVDHMSKKIAATLLELDEKEGPSYYLGYNNFYVITRYNHSPLYAMAVYELSQKIKQFSDKKAVRG